MDMEGRRIESQRRVGLGHGPAGPSDPMRSDPSDPIIGLEYFTTTTSGELRTGPYGEVGAPRVGLRVKSVFNPPTGLKGSSPPVQRNTRGTLSREGR